MSPKIITSHEYPPIPIRSHDWCAYREGMEEYGGYGWGSTEEAAISDLRMNEDDEAKPVYRPPLWLLLGGALFWIVFWWLS